MTGLWEFALMVLLIVAVSILGFGQGFYSGEKDTRTQLCTEANWQLPSCKEYLDKGIKQLKGEKL